MKTLVYIGRHFYQDSGTVMSTIYTELGERYDYGYMQEALANGEEFVIRQATPEEKELYEKLLERIKEREKK